MPLDRLGDWTTFSKKVLKHIITYTIPQYQNEDNERDQVGAWTADDCMIAIKRYVNRYGKNFRGNQEALRDLIKIAHYAQFTYDKLREELGEPDVYKVSEPMNYGETK
jgi:hypothetical protein